MRTKFLLESLNGRDHPEDLGLGGNIKMEFREIGFDGVD
jgi:hypothetical protein